MINSMKRVLLLLSMSTLATTAYASESCTKKAKTEADESSNPTYQRLIAEADERSLEHLPNDLLARETIWDLLPKEICNVIAQKVNNRLGALSFVFAKPPIIARNFVRNNEQSSRIILYAGENILVVWFEQEKK